MSALREAHRNLVPCSGAALAVLIVGALWPVEAAAQRALGTCVVNRATYRADTNAAASTNSSTFVNMPGTALTVTVGGANPTCVIVVFTGQVQATATENMVVRARIAGIGNGVPADFSMGPGTGTAEARPAQFVFENVPPGSHIVRMQYRSVAPGTTVTISRPTLVVHHR